MKIEDIQYYCAQSKIKWYKHVLERMQERDISRADVKNCIMHGEIIEDYPDDFPHPSCLIFGYTVNEKVIHAVVSLDAGNDSIGIITVYFPNTDKFEADLKTRKGALSMCMLCKCDTVKQSTTTHVVNYKGSVIIIKNVPCEECEQCGEIFYTDEVAERLEEMVNDAKKLLQEISVIDYSKVA